MKPIPPNGERFLDTWEKASKGTSAAAVQKQLGLTRYYARDLCRRNDTFKERYGKLSKQHQRQRNNVERLAPEEVRSRAQGFLRELVAQIDSGERINQREAAKAADVPIGTLYALRDPNHHSYDQEFEQIYLQVIGGKITEVEDFALYLATTPAAEINETGADWRQTTGVTNVARLTSPLFRDKREVRVDGDINLKGLVAHVATDLEDRFRTPTHLEAEITG